jgi:hypothetical protein
MAARARFLRLIFFGVLLLLPASFIHAQLGFYAELRFVQRLAWIGDEYALRYEVVIEKEEEGRFREQHREFSDMSFIEVSLSPGKYRYRVIPYDFLNRPAAGSDWVTFEVHPALMPELDDALPIYIYLSENVVHTLNILGKNFAPDAEIELRRPGYAPVVPINKNILPDGSQAWLYFSNDQLFSGIYELLVRNPGRLETRGGTIIVAYPETVVAIEEPEPIAQIEEPEPIAQIEEPEPIVQNDPVVRVQQPIKILEIDNVFFNVAWMPMFPIYGEDWFYERNLTLAGATARLGVVADMKLIYVGMELTGSWYAFDTGSHDLSMHFMSFGFNLLAQKRFLGGRLAVVFRVGGGASILVSGENENTGNTENSRMSGMAPVYVDFGVSLDWLITKNFYLETGIDYYHWFTDSPSGCFRPWIGMGLKF